MGIVLGCVLGIGVIVVAVAFAIGFYSLHRMTRDDAHFSEQEER